MKAPSLAIFLRYTAISALALVLDYGVYWMLASSGRLGVGPAAALGYSCGLVLAYVLMSARLFRGGWLAGRKPAEAALFAVSGLIGVMLSFAITEAYVRLIADNLHAAKIAATLVSFVVVYAFRRYVVFRPAAEAAQ